MPRKLAVALVSAVLVLSAFPLASLASTAQDAPPAQSAAPAPPRRPMARPTNLQVLSKDISSGDLITLMRSYTKALGVECTFCHAEDPQTHHLTFASDAKDEKATARIMIAMTMEINSQYLAKVKDPDATPADKVVVCATCHRGNSMPAPFTPGAAPPEKKP